MLGMLIRTQRQRLRLSQQPFSVVIQVSSVYVPSKLYYLQSKADKFAKICKDVDWHATKDTVFASVGDDKMLMMYGLSETYVAAI